MKQKIGSKPVLEIQLVKWIELKKKRVKNIPKQWNEQAKSRDSFIPRLCEIWEVCFSSPRLWGLESSSSCSPTSLFLLSPAWDEESGLYFPPKTPEESRGQAEAGDPACVTVFKMCSPPSFLESPVKIWEGLRPVEMLRQQKTKAEVWTVRPRGGSRKFLNPAFLGKCSTEWRFLPFTWSSLNHGFPSAAQQKATQFPMFCKPSLLPLSMWEGVQGPEGASFPASNPNFME